MDALSELWTFLTTSDNWWGRNGIANRTWAHVRISALALVIASVLAITEGFLPPTVNWSEPDPALGTIDPVPNSARVATVRVVQNNGFAFGGNNAIVILGEP